MSKTIEGKSNIKATVICDSVSSVNGKRITTLCLEYPRLIHSEFMTHRQFSRNAASSRAIPFDKMLKQLNGKPVRFGAANPGMQDKGEDFNGLLLLENDYGDTYNNTPSHTWLSARAEMIKFAKAYHEAGFAKQVYNRLLEPFSMMKTVVTSTEWANFFWLRLDEAADPTIQELARCMKQAMDESIPQELSPGQWHLPFVGTTRDHGEKIYFIGDISKQQWLTLEQAQKVSAARCAAVSFRGEDYGLEKCLQVYDRLVGGERKHSSALEHQATPMEDKSYYYEACDAPYLVSNWQDGITHMDKECEFWSGNFCGFIQYRQLIPNESKKG